MAGNDIIIAIDFDGTCVSHDYPHIGKDIGAEPVLRELVANGYRLILYTMRSGRILKNAVDWFKERNIPLFGVNENPEQRSWTSSVKPYANLYIDDAALGCPLIFEDGVSRPYADWARIREQLVKDGFL